MSRGLLIVFLACFVSVSSVVGSDLTLTPSLSVVEINYPVNISCKLDSAEHLPSILNGSASFQWRIPGGFVVNNGQSINGRISAISENSNLTVLVISKALLNDSGSLECLLLKNATNGIVTVLANATAELKTYELSSYFVEGMIVLSINCVLFVIFLVCSVRQCCVGRRKDDVYRKCNGQFSNSLPSQANIVDESNLMERGESG